ncbi:DUF4403 family protein [Persicitalea jodogahamensis]|uniref:DUF4403 family protein n=1 Tax=Persicitalea jodogahamensis TaxID=402147 RepID=A0A8J3G7Q7_9BACT|nr:DUF4403 family protein [Persicitalea jodogahamensis]GHB58843.1 hypothetical protein GCM10007390_10540 [Persicitalea jodogahamensis]
MQLQDEKHLSSINIPVEMPLIEMERQINAQLNGLIYEDNSYDDFDTDNLKAKVWKMSPIKVQAVDSTFLFEVPLKIWVSVRYESSPLGFKISGTKDTEFAIRLRFLSDIGVSPDWQVTTHTRVDSYDWITEPSIRVVGLNIPIKSMVSRMLGRNFEKITKAIDEQVAGTIELRKYVRQAWELARRPVLMSREYDTWLVIVPTSAMMTPLVVKNNILRTSIGIRGYTQTVTSAEEPEIRENSQLPNLLVVDKMPQEFKVGLISVIPYKEATRLAKAKFIGEKYSFNNGSYSVEVTNLEMYGQDEFLIIKAGLKGSLNGIIYLRGIPHYDPETKNLSLKDLDYDLDTRNVIFKTAGWLLQSKFSKMLEKQFVFPVGGQIEEARQSIQKTLQNNVLAKGVTLNGTISEIAPDRVYLTPENIYAVVFAKGRVALKVEGLL